MNAWLADHPVVAWLIIFALSSFVYARVFRVRRLPVLKEALVYALIALGSLLLLFFQVEVGLPIVPSLLVAVGMMAVFGVRRWAERRFGRRARDAVPDDAAPDGQMSGDRAQDSPAGEGRR